MNDSEVLFEGKVFSLYSQVALFDAGAKDSYPQWKTGDEYFVFGPGGVAVVTATDREIDVVVCRGKGRPEHSAICVSGENLIGDRGIIVGNVAAASVYAIGELGPGGWYSVTVYTNGIGTTTTRIHFFVDYLRKA